MSALLATPTAFEKPFGLSHPVEAIGIGRKAAVDFAERLNLLSNLPPTIIVFGCAGALNSSLRAGDLRHVTSVKGLNDSKTYDLSPQVGIAPIDRLMKGAILSTPRVIRSAHEKSKLFNEYQADLVDMEMQFLITSASPAVRERLVFLRCVIDEASDDLDFMGPKGPDLAKLLRPLALMQFSQFVLRYFRYQRSVTSFMRKLRHELK